MATIRKFQTKDGQTAEIRVPRLSDLGQFVDFVNALSHEDTFVMVSGERINRAHERKYLQSILAQVKKATMVNLVLIVDGKLVGNASITRGDRRKAHVGTLSVSLLATHRHQGLGTGFLQNLIGR